MCYHVPVCPEIRNASTLRWQPDLNDTQEVSRNWISTTVTRECFITEPEAEWHWCWCYQDIKEDDQKANPHNLNPRDRQLRLDTL